MGEMRKFTIGCRNGAIGYRRTVRRGGDIPKPVILLLERRQLWRISYFKLALRIERDGPGQYRGDMILQRDVGRKDRRTINTETEDHRRHHGDEYNAELPAQPPPKRRIGVLRLGHHSSFMR